MSSVAAFISGFAFFLVGLKLFSANLNQITSKRFRVLITRFTPNDWMAGLWGVLLSLLTAGNTILTPCITAGFKTVKAIDFRKSIQIVIWSRVGSCFFIYLAGFDIQVLVLFMMGMAGISFAINKPKRYITFASSVFNLGLVLFGIQQIKSSTKILIHFDWFSEIVHYTQQYPEIAFLAGFLFLICAQSLFGALVVALSFIDPDPDTGLALFNVQQAILFVYGVYLGEAVLKIFYLAAFKGVFRQVMCLLPLIYFAMFFFACFSYLFDRFLDIPSIERLAAYLASSPKQELAHVNFAVHLIAGIILSFFVVQVEKLVYLFVGEVKEEKMKSIDIPSEVFDDPVLTMSLISKEEMRIVQEIPLYMENIRSGAQLKNPLVHNIVHENFKKDLEIIHSIFSDLLKRSHYHPEICSDLLQSIEKHNFLMSLEDNIFHFSSCIDRLRESTRSNADLAGKFLNFVEALDATLLSMIDVFKDPKETFNLEILQQITFGKKDFMKEIRKEYSSQLAAEEKAQLIRLINLFESSIWIINKIAHVVVENNS